MVPSLDNFIDFGKDTFQQNAQYRSMALDIFTTVLTDEQYTMEDHVNGCALGESILLNMRGAIDDVGNMNLWTVFFSEDLIYSSSGLAKHYCLSCKAIRQFKGC
jgi:hypothetical protein